MFKRLPLRIKITMVTTLLLVICSVGLTLIISYAGKQMSVQIAEVTTPAAIIDPAEQPQTTPETAEQARVSMTLIEQNQILKRYYWTSFGYMILIISIGGLAAYYFAGEALLSVSELNKKIQASSLDNLSEPLTIPESNDEVAQLTRSFNALKRQLDAAFTFQKTFSANVAHELRTPLTVLKTKLAVFQRKNQALNQETQLFVADLDKQVTRLIEMVEKLLELTNDDEMTEQSEVALSDLFESIQFDFTEKLNAKQMSLSFDVSDKSVIKGDLDLLYQAFYNLIDNAIKYSEAQATIRISAREDEQLLTIWVTDTGIGIPKEHHAAIFNPLYRVDESRNRQIGGSGLGLAIVKKIITKHEGTIEIVEHEGTGTQFCITLPK
ncbi:sensor histidine kinase [Enterococcus alcedinis]|uniref:histidine kinase n=1 Tax=Enterococcus alcedinis TaxID=1274384 RepID=A0A917JE97_9ENTE|nr:ATP-binding protein [Enterococcus alcedinis]MBP2101699.1 signal transduction histidine kinase [Enterococcus alcedinis]GGI65263.1 hypothetical protein GCM10011482_09170 [Enterococcus alcedinis]